MIVPHDRAGDEGRTTTSARAVVWPRLLPAYGAARFLRWLLDAFTSDAVPVHLLTREAMALYLRKLAPGGSIASHVMNRHLELPSVVAGIAAANGLVTRVMDWSEDDDRYLFHSAVAAVARHDRDFGALLVDGEWHVQAPDSTQRVWTDDYSNIVGALLRHMSW